MGNLSRTGDEGGQVAKGLTELQLQLKDLDPSVVDFAKSGLLGKFFNPLRSYFAKYQKADAVISDIITSLDKGKSVLKMIIRLWSLNSRRCGSLPKAAKGNPAWRIDG